MKFIGESYSSYDKFGVAPHYFGFQYHTYISDIEDTHPILFGSANSFESYCVRMKIPHTYRQTDRRKFLFACFVF